MRHLKPSSTQGRLTRRVLSLGMLAVLSSCLILLTGSASKAQFSLPEVLGPSDGLNPPPEVTRLGSIEVAPVHSPITGAILFEVAAATVYDRSAATNIPIEAVERRAEEVNARIQRATLRRQAPQMNLATLFVGVGTLNNVDVVLAKDDYYTEPLVLVTVTQTDADYQGVPISELEEQWSQILDQELRHGIKQLSPEKFLQDAGQASRVLLGLLVFTGIFVVAKVWLRRYQRRLRDRKKALSAPPSKESSPDPQHTFEDAPAQAQVAQQRTRFLQGFDEVLGLDRRLNLLSLLQWLLFWSVVLAWYVGMYQFFRQFPFLEQFSDGVLGKPIELLGIWFLTGLSIRLLRRLIDRFTTEHEGFDFGDVLTFGDAQRRQLRISTIAGAAKGLVTVLLLSFGILFAMSTLGLPTGSVLAIGGIFGLAISFGSQSLVKDLVNGFLILAEDQFAIGDVIDLGNTAGLVENLNLRVTQLRSADGELVTVPNSNINQVKNLTRSWSRVNFSIEVAYQTDPAKALRVLKELSQAFYDEPEWQGKMLAPPDVLGIDTMAHTGMQITIWIQTEPSQQWAVGREFRLRVRQALNKNGIEIGIPRQTYRLESETESDNGQPAAGSGAISPDWASE